MLPRELLHEQHGDRVRLLARRAAGHPDPHRVVLALALDDGRDHLRGENLERRRLAKEPGDADQEVAGQLFHLARRGPQHLDVVGHPFQVGQTHAALDSTGESVALVAPEVLARMRPQHGQDRVHLIGDSVRRRLVQVAVEVRVFDEATDDLGHGIDREGAVGQFGGHRAARHSVVGRLRRVLHQHQPALLLDRLDAESTAIRMPRRSVGRASKSAIRLS